MDVIPETFANTVKALSSAEVEVVKRNELHIFAVLPKRWIVQRSFAWLDKFWKLWKTARVNYRTLFKHFLLPLFVWFWINAEKILKRFQTSTRHRYRLRRRISRIRFNSISVCGFGWLRGRQDWQDRDSALPSRRAHIEVNIRLSLVVLPAGTTPRLTTYFSAYFIRDCLYAMSCVILFLMKDAASSFCYFLPLLSNMYCTPTQ